MKHEEKLQAVTDKIWELLNRTDLKLTPHESLIPTDFDGNPFLIGNKSIREAEVLMALKATDTHNDSYLCFMGFDDKSNCVIEFAGDRCAWNLGKPLSEQKVETWEFLYDTLNCEP